MKLRSNSSIGESRRSLKRDRKDVEHLPKRTSRRLEETRTAHARTAHNPKARTRSPTNTDADEDDSGEYLPNGKHHASVDYGIVEESMDVLDSESTNS